LITLTILDGDDTFLLNAGKITFKTARCHNQKTKIYLCIVYRYSRRNFLPGSVSIPGQPIATEFMALGKVLLRVLRFSSASQSSINQCPGLIGPTSPSLRFEIGQTRPRI
jgi:hypothetical protein